MRLSIEILPLLYKFSLQPLQPIEPSSPARMVVLLLLLLGLGQTQALDEPGQGQLTVSQETLDVWQGLQILWNTFNSLRPSILSPLLPPVLEALFRRRKVKEDAVLNPKVYQRL